MLIRWLAIFGQTAAVLFVAYGLGFELPLSACLFVIGMSVVLNLGILISRQQRMRAAPWPATLFLAYDILQLSALLGLTGGLDNPFVFFLIAPTTVAAAALAPKHTALLTGLTLICICALAMWALKLPWIPGESFAPPTIYRLGLSTAVITSIVFTTIYAWRVSAEEDRLRSALFATEAVLAREQQVAALGGLAAAAAHELGTPLATIQVTAKEMVNDIPKGTQAAEDAALILAQAQRCRDILKALSAKPVLEDKIHDRLSLEALLTEATAPHAHGPAEVRITVESPDSSTSESVTLLRRQELIHALGAFVENATSFAKTQVEVIGRSSSSGIEVLIRDDGPGFSEAALTHLGEPFVSYRDTEAGGGMGLGFFIAKTLVERSGGQVKFFNRTAPRHGAVVRATWPPGILDAPALV